MEANIFGKYNSFYQASEACKKWKDKGIRYIMLQNDYLYGGYKEIQYNSRSCKGEATTKQILGLEEIGVKDGESYTWEEFQSKSFPEKVKKNFRY